MPRDVGRGHRRRVEKSDERDVQASRGPRVRGVDATPERVASTFTLPPFGDMDESTLAGAVRPCVAR
jgi:hypothetical protein